ncbi:hypothetical protein EVAR_44157_1 [Eumeta japonica]|uniref:Uncharacterized protein n=1 Tax=Eumeta variegata TaxID=151549 RepID=A0A4C1XLR2_EUMVA|nr:hypothetical protein EVAR_44157_1 [Eumeta japonica]
MPTYRDGVPGGDDGAREGRRRGRRPPAAATGRLARPAHTNTALHTTSTALRHAVSALAQSFRNSSLTRSCRFAGHALATLQHNKNVRVRGPRVTGAPTPAAPPRLRTARGRAAAGAATPSRGAASA